MPVAVGACLLASLLGLAGLAPSLALAQGSESEAPATREPEGGQEVREIQEPAPEAVELELTRPGETEAEDEDEDEFEDDERESFGDRFRRGELFGVFDVQGRFFPLPAADQGLGPPFGTTAPVNDYWFNGSMAWEPGFFMNVTDYMNFELILFGRVDQHDRKRTHGDIREGFFELFFDEWSFGFGIHKVFWGVAESRHLVDIINQTDLVEDFDTDIKLGQAMLTGSYTHDKAGIYSLYVMSWARPLVFPSLEGRPGLPIPVDNSLREYESRLKQGQIDVAFRWSHSMGGFDWGLSYFFGTAREPQLSVDFSDPAEPVFRPFYALIHQPGLDAQYTVEGWLLKLETIMRAGQGPTFGAVTGGFEYTFYQVHDSIVDIGVILEYNYDGRDADLEDPNANNTFIVFENDFFVGMRLSLSDVGSTEFLLGSFIDVDDGSLFIGAEASRRFGEHWKILLEGRGYVAQQDNVLTFFEQDASIQVDIEFRY